jgi:inosine/xanthosine triphosphatase
MPINVIVASKNPVKIQATTQGCRTFFPDLDWTVTGVSVPSGVSDQPMSDQETLQGALNRANTAMEQYPDATLWVGVEGGCAIEHERMWVFAWVVIRSKTKIEQAKTSAFCLPHNIAQLVEDGEELGIATDIAFGKHNTKHSQGVVGMLSNGHIDRTEYYIQPMILALMGFTQAELLD